EAVSAAVTYINAKLALLVDGSEHTRRHPAFASELVPLLTALEIDRFGIVAHVLARRHGCTAENFNALTWLGVRVRLFANLRDHTFDEQVTKFALTWNSGQHAAADGSAAAAPTVALPNPSAMPSMSSPMPNMVSPRYDFPSAQSI